MSKWTLHLFGQKLPFVLTYSNWQEIKGVATKTSLSYWCLYNYSLNLNGIIQYPCLGSRCFYILQCCELHCSRISSMFIFKIYSKYILCILLRFVFFILLWFDHYLWAYFASRLWLDIPYKVFANISKKNKPISIIVVWGKTA